MTNRVATVIACADLPARVVATLTSVERQTAGIGEIVLVSDETTPAAALEWLDALARARGARRVHAASALPGVAWNAGIAATTSPYVMCVDAGDALASRCHVLAVTALERDQADIATSPVQWVGPGSAQQASIPEGCDLESILDDPDAIHSASVFARRLWLEAGGFDEQMMALVEYDFWLRLLTRGARATVLEPPLLVRVLRTDGRYRRRWAAEADADAWRLVIERHAEIFGRDPARVLRARETKIVALSVSYHRELDRRDAAVRELEALNARVAHDRARLPPAWRDRVNAGDLRRTTPISRNWGYERGTPVDRYYIERFLEQHASDIRGVVLEVQEADYTARFGEDRVSRRDVVDLDTSNPRATIVADLRCAANIASDTYDCIILTQTLHVIDDMRAVIAECARILKPGGILLATLPSASRVCLEYGADGDFWRVTEAGARTMFSEIFPVESLDVRAHGNVLVTTAFLYGLAANELTDAEFAARDPYFPTLVTVRAEKGGGRVASARVGAEGPSGAILLYHRVGQPSPDVHGLAVSPDEFRRQMTYLRDRCTPMPLDEFAAAARAGQVPPRAVAVTFDDGYGDNLTQASPILLELGVPATFFLTTDRLDDERFEYWWDTLARLLLSGAAAPTDLQITLPDGAHAFPTRTLEDRQQAHAAIYKSIVASGPGERDAVLDALVGWAGGLRGDVPAACRMRPAEIRELASRAGHAIGAHSARHLMLPAQPASVQRAEVEESRRSLESLLGRRVSAFAYPFGAWSGDTVEIVRAAGFEVAVTCDDGCVAAGADSLRLPRLEPPRDGQRFSDWIDARLRAR